LLACEKRDYTEIDKVTGAGAKGGSLDTQTSLQQNLFQAKIECGNGQRDTYHFDLHR
jgi:hypothetical protein